jgi:chromosome segregation ATPase
MPTIEERVSTLEDIARKHDRSIDLLSQLAEGHNRVEQQIVRSLEDLTSRFVQMEETNRLLVTGMEALQTGMESLQTEVQGLRTEMGEFRIQVGTWAQTVEQRFDALPGIIAKVVADELRPVTAALNALPDAIAKAVAEEFRPLLSLREDMEDLRRRVEALEKK